jgi:hypothetical protein
LSPAAVEDLNQTLGPDLKTPHREKRKNPVFSGGTLNYIFFRSGLNNKAPKRA